MPYLCMGAIFINIGARVREKTSTQVFYDSHYKEYLRKELQCGCMLFQNDSDMESRTKQEDSL